MSDTIAAVSTGNAICAIGILRLSGDDAVSVAEQVFVPSNGKPLSQAADRRLLLGDLYDRQGRIIDNCCAIVSRAPHSYTGENTVELHCHGSPAVLAAGLESLYLVGARPAGRGEFTKRAFLNGKLALTQAEAVIDLIEADSTDAAANAAGQVGGVLQRRLTPVYDDLTDLCSHFHAVLDYPDEDIEDFGLSEYESTLCADMQALSELLQTYAHGRILRQGVAAAIVGKPNVGKSSLLNALVGYDRCIVTDIPGTTRDTVEESVMLGATRLRLIDTAGIRETQDAVEAIGVERSRAAVEQADLVIAVCDGSAPLDEDDLSILSLCGSQKNVIVLLNKSDLGCAVAPQSLAFPHVLSVCAASGAGLAQLAETVNTMFANALPCDGSILTNARQLDAIRRAHDVLGRALTGLRSGMTPDMVLLDVEDAMQAIGEVTGATVREDITARIFERFCVGK